MVTVRQKMRAQLVAQGRWDEMSAADAYFEDIGYVPQRRGARRPCGRRRTRRPRALLPRAATPSGCCGCLRWRATSRASIAAHRVVPPREPGRVEITGWAVLRALGITGRTARAPRLAGRRDRRADRRPDHRARAARRPTCGAASSTRRTTGAGSSPPSTSTRCRRRTASWHLEVETTYDGITTRGSIHNQVRESAGSRESGIAHTWDDTTATVRARWHGGAGSVPRRGHRAGRGHRSRRAVGRADRQSPGTGGAHDRRAFASRRRMPRRSTSPPARARRGGLQRPLAAPGQARPLAPDRGDRSAPGDAAVARRPRALAERRARWKRSPDGGPSVVPVVPTLEVTEVRLDDESITVTVHAPETTDEQMSTVALANPRTTLPLQDVSGRGRRLAADLRALRQRLRPAAALRRRAPATSSPWTLPGGPSHAMVAPSYAGRMPQRFAGPLTNLRIAQWRNGRFGAYLEPALPPDVLGACQPEAPARRLPQQRGDPARQRAVRLLPRRVRHRQPAGARRALAQRRPDLTRYWGVADTSTMVPEGSVPLLDRQRGVVRRPRGRRASSATTSTSDPGSSCARTSATCRPSTATRSSRWASTSGAARASPTRRSSATSTAATGSGTPC